MIVERDDQLNVIINNPKQSAKHYSLVEVRGIIINTSDEEIHIVAHSWSNVQSTSRIGQDIPSAVPPKFETQELVLLTIEVNKDDIDPIEDMFQGSFKLQYADGSGVNYITKPALFEVSLAY